MAIVETPAITVMPELPVELMMVATDFRRAMAVVEPSIMATWGLVEIMALEVVPDVAQCNLEVAHQAV